MPAIPLTEMRSRAAACPPSGKETSSNAWAFTRNVACYAACSACDEDNPNDNGNKYSQARWISLRGWGITNVPMQVRVPPREPNRVDLEPPAEGRAVLPCPEGVQPDDRLEPAALVQVAPRVQAPRPGHPRGVQHGRAAERVVHVALDH